ncbi:MAG: hypothetical protein NT075_03965 [Chloroflexi bacterium]|nr:hypothetical protein [Chloroflexota bacterium]
MSSIVALLLAGTVVSTAIKAGILVAGVKAYRASHQDMPEPAAQTSLSKRIVHWAAQRGAPHTEVQPLQAWGQKTLPVDDEIRIWLATLKRPEAQALTKDVKAFCATWQIDLAWLSAPPLAPFAEFQAQLDEIVLAYCRVHRAAQQIQHANASA